MPDRRSFRMREGLSRLLGPLLALAALFPGAYTFFIRPWHLRWGATDEERAKALPGPVKWQRELPGEMRAS